MAPKTEDGVMRKGEATMHLLKTPLTFEERLGKNRLLRVLYRTYFHFPEWLKIFFEIVLIVSSIPLFLFAGIFESVNEWAHEQCIEGRGEGIEGILFGLFISLLFILWVFAPWGWIPGAMTLYFFIVTKMNTSVAEYHSELSSLRFEREEKRRHNHD